MPANKILIVDDEPSFTQLVIEYLRSTGYEAFSANNLEEAINLFKTHRPKAVILDFNMPVVTGEKLLPILQSLEPTVRVIVCTGCLEEEVEDRFKGLGYFAYFEKGTLSLDKLRRKIDEAFTV